MKNAAAKLQTRTADSADSRASKDQGMNWIRQDKRLAIYLRDGNTCTYCGTPNTADMTMTLDHLTPYVVGGSNGQENLVTCCLSCNSSRQDMELGQWLVKACGERAETVGARIETLTATNLRPYRVEAKAIIAARKAARKAA